MKEADDDENSKQSEFASPVNIYPNPTKGFIIIDIDDDSENAYSIEVLNIIGQRVYSEKEIMNRNLVIDLSSYSTGIYFVKISKADQLFIKKIIKQ